MATNFFEHQDEAQRNTSRLVILFGLAVVCLVALLYALAVVLTNGAASSGGPNPTPIELAWWQPELLVQVGLATLAVVSGGSLFKIAQLRGGGRVVAESLGGEPIPPDTRDPLQRKVLNIVEEMAIASGTPTPPVYLLSHEPGINAFAAGFAPTDAVIGVTRGCAEQLSRDELQGVIAHEFSHILNGDMRLNIRLMGVLHGILLIGIIGYFLLRSSMFAGHAGRRSDRDNSGAFMLAAGLGLMVAGFMGTFFGNLIKASVSRQREFLADASAVQFTRNPAGIAGALKKIGGFEAGSTLETPNAPEASHLLFGQGLHGGLQMLFATHPPLEARIRRLDPDWQEGATSSSGTSASADTALGFAGGLAEEPAARALDQIGQPSAAHLAYAAELIRGLDPTVVEATHEPFGARAVVYALVIDRDPEARRIQLDQLSQFGDPAVAQQTLRLLPAIEALDIRARLPLVDLALPALRSLSATQYQAFEHNLRALVDADQKIDLFEWTLQRILLTHLRPHFERVRPPRVRHTSARKMANQIAIVLSILAHAGGRDGAAARTAFEGGLSQLEGADPELLPREQCHLAHLDRALADLDESSPAIKRQVLSACASCIEADGRVTTAEGELLRAIADALDCPMPPLLPGQRLS